VLVCLKSNGAAKHHANACQCVLKAMAQQSIMQTCVGVFEKQWRSKASCKRVLVCLKSNGAAKHHANVWQIRRGTGVIALVLKQFGAQRQTGEFVAPEGGQ